MTFIDYIIGFSYGCAGGLAVEFLGLYKIRTLSPKERPKYYATFFYWVATFGMIVMGGGLVAAYLHSGIEVSPILGINIGASAPLIIGAFAKGIPELSPGTTDLDGDQEQQTLL